MQVQSNGGEYSAELSKRCTHLICAFAIGKKYEAALKWGLNCVGIEWLNQSIERGMSLDAKYFTLDIEPSKRGEGAWNKALALKSSDQLGLLAMSGSSEVPVDFENGVRKRRLRRAASKIAQEGIWEGILEGVTDASNVQDAVTNSNGEQNPSTMQPVPFVAESSSNVMGLEFNRGPFDGMTFYSWGFIDKKVVHQCHALIGRKISSPMLFQKAVDLCSLGLRSLIPESESVLLSCLLPAL
jgi:DNA replication regulator DPB11